MTIKTSLLANTEITAGSLDFRFIDQNFRRGDGRNTPIFPLSNTSPPYFIATELTSLSYDSYEVDVAKNFAVLDRSTTRPILSQRHLHLFLDGESCSQFNCVRCTSTLIFHDGGDRSTKHLRLKRYCGGLLGESDRCRLRITNQSLVWSFCWEPPNSADHPRNLFVSAESSLVYFRGNHSELDNHCDRLHLASYSSAVYIYSLSPAIRLQGSGSTVYLDSHVEGRLELEYPSPRADTCHRLIDNSLDLRDLSDNKFDRLAAENAPIWWHFSTLSIKRPAASVSAPSADDRIRLFFASTAFIFFRHWLLRRLYRMFDPDNLKFFQPLLPKDGAISWQPSPELE